MGIQHDALIVGAGGAGLWAAVELARAGVDAAVLTKLYPTRSHTGAAQGGVCAALGNLEEDHWEWHMYDTVKGGDYLVDQDAAEILAREAIETVIELEHMGLPFNRTEDGKIDQRRFGGHTRNYGEGPVRRSCFAADRTGHMILQTLYQQCIKHGVKFYDEYHVVDLLTEGGELGDGGRAAGVVAYRIADGSLHTIGAKAVMLATGGFGRMFRITSNAWSLTGDGVALTYRHGIPMQDMEFYQFHPTGIVGIGILLSEAVRGEGAVKRACFAADRTGHMILQTLYQQCLKHGVKFYDEYHVVDLVTEGGELGDGGRAAGVVAYRIADGDLVVLRSKAVMLATGGFGRMVRVTSNAWSLT
ncbi:MAG: FAD-dependent oxidoreductase, partial [Candidatus Limnocylindria bacterium]